MAVFTQLSDQHIRDVLAFFDAGGLVGFEPILQGTQNTNYRVVTTRAAYVLTLFEKQVDPADLPFFFGFIDHLAAAGIPCPQPARDPRGGAVATVKDRSAALFPFLMSGTVMTPADVTPPVCGTMGGILANMHEAGASFGMKRPNNLTLSAWRELYERTAARADEVAPGLARIIGEEIDFLTTDWPDRLPVGAIHADLFPDNVFLDYGHVTGLIDFYYACTDFLAYDLAIVINAWCFSPGADPVFMQDRFDALMTAYERIRPLDDAERRALPVLLRGAALRFMMTRLRDKLFHDPDSFVNPHNPLEYLAKLEFHRHEQIIG